MSSSNQDILDALESIAREAPVSLLEQRGMMACAHISAAISLKRIADKLEEGLPVSVPQETYLKVIDLAYEAGQSFTRGRNAG